MLPLLFGFLAGALLFSACFQLAAGWQRADDRRHLWMAAACLLAALFCLAKVRIVAATDVDTWLALNRLELAVVVLLYPSLFWYFTDGLPTAHRRWRLLAATPAPLFALLSLLLPLGLQYSAIDGLRYATTPWGEAYLQPTGRPNPLFLLSAAWVVALQGLSCAALGARLRRAPNCADSVQLTAMLILVASTVLGILARLGGVDLHHIGVLALGLVVLCVSLVHVRVDRRERLRAMARLDALVGGAPDGILVVDADGRIVEANPVAERLFAAESGGLRERRIEQLVPPAFRARHAGQRRGFMDAPKVRTMAPQTLLSGLRDDGSEVALDISLAPIEWGEQRATVAFVRDASERAHHLARLRWLTEHDELTALPKRCQLLARLAQGDAQAAYRLVLLGIDHVGRINEAFGHEHGDLLIKEVAQRLSDALDSNDTVARLDGDRFALVVVEDAGTHGRLEHCRLLVAKPVELPQGVRVDVAVTGGYAVWPRDGRTPGELLQAAESALLQAKRRCRGGFLPFDPAMLAQDARWLQLASRLREAFDRREFRMVYQPRIAAVDGKVTGFEALMRWNAAEGPISPAEFIPVAEQSGFIAVLGEWAIEEVVAQLRRWLDLGIDPGCVGLNLSARQLIDPQLAQRLAATVLRLRVPPSRVVLEVTESIAMENLADFEPHLRALADLGFTLAIDDFGTGYSSLAYLQRLPFSVVKIDVSFVRALDTPDGEALMRGLIALTHALNRITVAEGVETAAQRDWLVRGGCEELQGYLLGRPLEADDVPAWILGR